MTYQTKGSSRIVVNAVVTRADGTVEDWGVLNHKTKADKFWYAVKNPRVIFNRQKWRLRQWFHKFKIQG